MVKCKALKTGDKVAVISLSRGILGESVCKHNVEIGSNRLKEFGLEVVFMEHTLKGLEFIENNPKARAYDLKEAFKDDEIKGIICAIGGTDTYRTLEFLMEDEEFKSLVKEKPKLFLGFSDSTTNHLMFYKLGLQTFYGQSFLADVAEIAKDMLPYSKNAFKGLFEGNETKEIISSDLWYDERTDFSLEAVGTDRVAHKEQKGFEVLQGDKNFNGKLLGGCVDTIIDGLFTEGIKEVYTKYDIFPKKEEWVGKIMFLETSEDKISPKKLKDFLEELKARGILDVVKGIILGKPQDEVFYEEYKKVYTEVVNKNVPIVYNVNFGHALPRCILPYGVEIEVDIVNKKIVLLELMFQ